MDDYLYPSRFQYLFKDDPVECKSAGDYSGSLFNIKSVIKTTTPEVVVELLDLIDDSSRNISNTSASRRVHLFRGLEKRYTQFFADEVTEKCAIVGSMVLSQLGLSYYKHQARKLVVRNVSITKSREFFNTNHLMGYRVGRTIGLYSGDDLICALSYISFQDHIEIARFCTKLRTSCAGGFGKLVSQLQAFNKPITSYCDLRYSDGHSYEAVGFKNAGETIGFNWTDGSRRFNRLMCKATTDKTEKQVAAEKGWFKIFDAGQRKYVLLPPK